MNSNLSSSTELISRIQSTLQRSLTATTPITINPQALSQIINHSKQLIHTIQVLKQERKSYTTILQNNKAIQIKLNNHNNTIQSIQNSFNQRMKTLSDENKALKDQLDKQKKYYQDKYQNVDKEIEGMKEENQNLNNAIKKLMKQIEQYKEINRRNGEIILQKQNIVQTMSKINSFSDLGEPKDKNLQSLFASKLNTTLIKYLSPRDIRQVLQTNRIIRQSIMNTRSTTCQIFKIINITNRRKNKFLQKHVKHFDVSCQKISQDIIQTAFYKYMILKKNIGQYILNILTDCSLLFEGKFVENTQELPIIDTRIEQVQQYEQFPVDDDVKQMYKEQLMLESKMISDQVYTLLQKIQNASQLYSADVESNVIFLNNLQSNYSKLFVFSKKLCSEAKHLQMLNTYLIKMLVDRQHFQITKNSQIQDIKAQLQSQSKIKNFFSAKSINSEQRCLSLENQKLNFQMRLKDLSQRYYDLQQLKKKWQEDNKQLAQKNQILIKDNKLFKQNFDQVHLKYTKIMQELEVLRNNLQKMNLSEH